MNDDEDKTPAQSPNAKKSSGAWKFNIDGAVCPRQGCGHRRDEHALNERRVAENCMLCDCPHFFVGGADYDKLPDTLPEDPESKP